MKSNEFYYITKALSFILGQRSKILVKTMF